MQWCHWNLELYPACLKFRINFFFSQFQVECFELHYNFIFSSFILLVISMQFLILQFFWHLLELPEEIWISSCLASSFNTSNLLLCWCLSYHIIILSLFQGLKSIFPLKSPRTCSTSIATFITSSMPAWVLTLHNLLISSLKLTMNLLLII